MRTRVGIIAAVFCTLCFAYGVQAQVPEFSVAQTFTITDKDAVDGDIMSLATDKQGITRAIVANDQHMYGVLVAKPVAVYKTQQTIPVARDGIVMVNVTNLSGAIKIGDFITSSAIAGKGQKAPELTGYMLGIALESFDGKNGTNVSYNGKTYMGGKIKMTIGIGPSSPILTKASGGVFGTLQQFMGAFLFNIRGNKETEKLMRYLLALIIIITVTIVNFRTFGRNVTKGIEAIGRNPLARVAIQTMITVNIILLIIVELAAVALCFVIITT